MRVVLGCPGSAGLVVEACWPPAGRKLSNAFGFAVGVTTDKDGGHRRGWARGGRAGFHLCSKTYEVLLILHILTLINLFYER